MAKAKKAKKLTPAQAKFKRISEGCRVEVVGDKKMAKALFKKVGACVKKTYAAEKKGGAKVAKKSARKAKKK